MKIKFSFAAIVGFICLCLFAGCSTPENAVTRFLFDTTTNYVPHVVMETNAVGNQLVVTVQTNLTPVIESKPSADAMAWAGTISAVADMFAPGVGKLTLLGATGALGIYGVSRQRKLSSVQGQADTMTAATETLAQSLEVFREVLKQTPQGQALNVKLTDMLERHQLTAGVIREVANVVRGTVDNDKAKRIADAIIATLPANAPQTASAGA